MPINPDLESYLIRARGPNIGDQRESFGQRSTIGRQQSEHIISGVEINGPLSDNSRDQISQRGSAPEAGLSPAKPEQKSSLGALSEEPSEIPGEIERNG